ncbi:tetratricopeptide repeat protein [Candidatus Gracilibacteria bacterium]|nr:tetratricopeptide repeat protein [Candidatus Gracilibacteria bacterium]
MYDMQSLLEEAETKKQHGDHQEAIKICERILNYDLDFTEAYEEIADNYLTLREYQKAKRALDRAIALDPQSPNGNYLMGFVYSCMGKWKTSIEYLEKAEELFPNHPEILRCLGWSIYHNGEKRQGVILLERALNLAPNDALILTDLGVLYMNEKNFERAMRMFTKVLVLDPENTKARECLNAVKFFAMEYGKLKGQLSGGTAAEQE